MTIGQLKKNTMKMLEEYEVNQTDFTADKDYQNKFYIAINSICHELSRIFAVVKRMNYFQQTLVAIKLPDDFLKLNSVLVNGKSSSEYIINRDEITVFDFGNVTIIYDGLPQSVNDKTSNDELIPFKENVCEIMPYGIAKILLLGTGQSNEAREFEEKYYNYLQELSVYSTANKGKLKITNRFRKTNTF